MVIVAMKLRHLLLGRKVMSNLDSIFKSRDITLPTKVRLVKAMVFPVVMYGCESWTVKKSYDKLRQCIKGQIYYFADKGLSSQSYGFSSSRVWM